mmetsp:Transcript_13142/g.20431  ORF Transcript_13142/g.20431 Transcript_13142/m.20431 type:complete len:269 (+) Transcript_13142:1161-1967(+)
MSLRVVDVILKEPAVLTNGEEAVLGLALLVEALAERDRGHFNLVGEDLTAELPLDGLGAVAVQVVLLEQTHGSVGIAHSEVLAVVRYNQLGDRVALALGRLQRRIQLAEVTGLRIHNLNLSVVLRYEDLGAVRGELDGGEDLDGLTVFLLGARLLLAEVLVVADGVSLLEVVPQQDEALRAGDGQGRVVGVHGDGANRRFDSTHDSVALLLGRVDFLENVRLEHADHSTFVSYQKVRALEHFFGRLLFRGVHDSGLGLSLGEADALDG